VHLCKYCKGLILTDEILKRIPTSRLPNNLPALDLVQRYIDLLVKRKDKSPGFLAVKSTASKGCRFCAILLEAIEHDKSNNEDQWRMITDGAEVHISFRYNCTAELGKQSILPGE
jgi:hypothetical protein